ncbi:MAG: hypothetical protein L0216_22030 [Planctomycetales bacterium]|nr:hypothetical protein [Planctomycetales bacterium]
MAARDGWFDGRGVELNNSTVRARRAAWERILREGAVPADARVRLRQEIYKRLQSVEPRLPDDVHRELTEILVGYEMLVEMHDRKLSERRAGAPEGGSRK